MPRLWEGPALERLVKSTHLNACTAPVTHENIIVVQRMLNVKCVLGRVSHARIIGLLPRRSVTDSETGVCPRARLTPPTDTRREAFVSLRRPHGDPQAAS